MYILRRLSSFIKEIQNKICKSCTMVKCSHLNAQDAERLFTSHRKWHSERLLTELPLSTGLTSYIILNLSSWSITLANDMKDHMKQHCPLIKYTLSIKKVKQAHCAFSFSAWDTIKCLENLLNGISPKFYLVC